MGVPVVSLVGDRHASRVGLSLLTAIGHSEWAMEKIDDYIEKAIALALDRPLREKLRCSLRSELMNSVLMAYPSQTSRFEAALRQTWQNWCSSQN
jgi:predicted O-linked N-acetylglucosamine transferase (SPINDLY family)